MLGQLTGAGNTTTLSHYLDLLSQAGLLAGLEKFASNQTKQRSSSPKFQVFNTALITSQQHESFGEIMNLPAQWGRLVESSVGAHLVNHALTDKITLNYWRDRNDEVDFVIPANDDAVKTVEIIVKTMADAIIEGNAKAKEIKAEESAEGERVKKERETENHDSSVPDKK